MRKFHKQQLLDIIQSLHILHQESRDKLAKKDYSAVQTALSDCQEAAIQMGEAIEQIVGNGTEAVDYLEKYCEKLYQINIQIKEIQAQKFYKTLENILIKAENSISHMPVRKEAVFIPYKASMWDSLESVWKAADADPNCDVYVIPIPYFDKNPDGSFREMHYEADLYPSYVPVSNYDEFDFGLHRPDMIYIHNPYDTANFVTSVHPFFYSDNLKQYTDNLIYIPYFVLDEKDPNNKVAVEGMKHFCTVPAVFNADKVIVQSEKMRQIYINVLTEETGEETRGIWEERILGLGSPKYDKVANTRKEDLEIPEEWMKIIEKPDGGWKKIIFYNTSVNALLHNNEDMIKKMQHVFNIFKDNQDEVALLWRPHPLIQATVSSMRPQLWLEYEKLLKQYKEEGWGIYDDSADLDRAIEISDAYYGDASSVVQLYQQTGKPVMMQAVENLKNEGEKCDKFPVKSIMGYTYDNEKIYLISSCIYAILEYDCHSKNTKILADFPEEVRCVCAFERILKYGKKIYLFPCLAEDIYCYDLEKGTYYKSNILSSVIESMPKRKLFEVLEYNGYIYCVCQCPDIVIRIDPGTDDFQIYSIPLEILKEYKTMEKPSFSVRMNDNKLVYPCGNNGIIEFLTDVNSFKIISLDGSRTETQGDNDNIILGVCADGSSNYYIYNLMGEVYKIIDNKKILIDIPKNFTQRYHDGWSEQQGIDRLFIINDDLCFILRSVCKILKYNTITGSVTLCENNLAEWNDKIRQMAFSNCAAIDEKTFLLFNSNDSAIYKWNYTNGFTEKIEIKISLDAIVGKQYVEDYWRYRNCDNLEGYILYVKSYFGKRKCEEYVNCGEKIYQKVI